MDDKIFFDELREHQFDGSLSQGQVDNINCILNAWDKYKPQSDPRFIAYSLGTVYRECGSHMNPVEENGHGRGKKYGKPTGKFKQVYFGRGYVQLTWDYNYKFADEKLHELGILGTSVSLLREPELALKQEIAAPILVLGMIEGWFNHRKLSDFFVGTRSDWVDARTIINGHDHAQLVASYGMTFYHALTTARAA